jgi:hypothetical protein
MNRKGRNCCNKCEDEGDEQGGGKAKSLCKHKTKNNVKERERGKVWSF